MKLAYRWLLVVAWMALIFMFSNEVAGVSSQRSGTIVNDLQTTFSLDANFSLLEVITRKAAHLTLYFILGGLLFFALYGMRRFSASKSAILAVAATFLYACTDEFHQAFVPGRGSQFTDVLIDTVGGAVAVFICYYYVRYKAQKEHRHHEEVKKSTR